MFRLRIDSRKQSKLFRLGNCRSPGLEPQTHRKLAKQRPAMFAKIKRSAPSCRVFRWDKQNKGLGMSSWQGRGWVPTGSSHRRLPECFYATESLPGKIVELGRSAAVLGRESTYTIRSVNTKREPAVLFRSLGRFGGHAAHSGKRCRWSKRPGCSNHSLRGCFAPACSSPGVTFIRFRACLPSPLPAKHSGLPVGNVGEIST